MASSFTALRPQILVYPKAPESSETLPILDSLDVVRHRIVNARLQLGAVQTSGR